MIGTVLQLLVFAGAAAAAISAIVITIVPQRRRIARLALGRVEQPVDRWRALHLEADRRRPFEIRVDGAERRRRGLPGRRSR